MKRTLSIALSIITIFVLALNATAVEDMTPFDVDAKSAVLMEASTGKILYAKNADEALPPASVTKIMTILLVMERIDSNKMSFDDMISVSEYAASMGGSQVFLEAGEEMSLRDMLKSVVIASANDAAVALAEAVAGSEEGFVKMMNDRAEQLGMKNTVFENVTGLDDDTVEHLTSAFDIALMSRELIVSHPSILNYSSIWMDSIRNGEFGLTNTNRLIRFYKGANGLKTGSTSKAGFCISATAERDGMELIAVIMGSENRDIRNEAAKKLLDYGFANYAKYEYKGDFGENVKVLKGEKEYVRTRIEAFSAVVEKGSASDIEIKTEYKDKIIAPVKKGEVVGKAEFYSNGRIIGETDIIVKEGIDVLDFPKLLSLLFKAWILN